MRTFIQSGFGFVVRGAKASAEGLYHKAAGVAVRAIRAELGELIQTVADVQAERDIAVALVEARGKALAKANERLACAEPAAEEYKRHAQKLAKDVRTLGAVVDKIAHVFGLGEGYWFADVEEKAAAAIHFLETASPENQAAAIKRAVAEKADELTRNFEEQIPGFVELSFKSARRVFMNAIRDLYLETKKGGNHEEAGLVAALSVVGDLDLDAIVTAARAEFDKRTGVFKTVLETRLPGKVEAVDQTVVVKLDDAVWYCAECGDRMAEVGADGFDGIVCFKCDQAETDEPGPELYP